MYICIPINTSKLVIGSDEETALVNAITRAFPDSTHILCTRHIRQNTKQKLVDDSVGKSDRDKILNMIFGQNGLTNSDDSICFEEKSDEIEQECQNVSEKFHKYYKKKSKQT